MTDIVFVPVGPYTLKVEKTSKGISKVEISKEPLEKTKKKSKNVIQIEEVFHKFIQGKRDVFGNVSLDPAGTEFQKKVWKAAQAIPYGETRTYAQIAAQIGHPKALRAVGTALGKNPVCIVVPCHRVVPSSGGIGQYAYGKAMKQWLLDHEAGRL